MPADNPKTAASPQARPVPRRRRWIRRIALTLVGLIIVLAGVVQGVLWSSIPKRIAIAQIQNLTSARTSIDSVSVSWLGHTTVRGVKLTLPLDDVPLVTIDALEIDHASIPLIALNERIDRVMIDGVKIDVRQRDDGTWNFQQIDTGESASASSAPSNFHLPEILVRHAGLNLTPAGDPTIHLDDLSLDAMPKGPSEYAVQAAVGAFVKANGKIALTRGLDHQLQVKLNGLPPDVVEIAASVGQPIAADFAWSGGRNVSGFSGKLQIASASAGAITVDGVASIAVKDDATISITPASLAIHSPQLLFNSITLNSGTIQVAKTISIRDLRASVDQGSVAMEGTFDPATFSGDARAAWQQVQQSGVGATGNAAISFNRALGGEYSGKATVHSSIDLPEGSADANLNLEASGRTLRDIRAVLKTDPLNWKPVSGKPLSIPALQGSINARGNKLVLSSLQPLDGQVGEFVATGEFDLDVKTWWASAHSRSLDMSQFRLRGLKNTVDLNVDAYGSLTRLDLKQAYVRHDDLQLYATGFYDTSFPKPAKLSAWVWYNPKPAAEDDARFNGVLAHGQIEGTLQPRALAIAGVVSASNLIVTDREIGDISINVNGQLTDWQASFATSDMQLLGGEWKILGEWTAFSDQPPRVTANWKNLPIASLADAANIPGVTGQIEKGQAIFSVPSLRLRDWTMQASFNASAIQARGVDVDSVDVNATLDHGDFSATPVFKRGDGVIDAAITAKLGQAQPIKLAANITSWPAPSLGISSWATDLVAQVSGKVDGEYLVASKSLSANAKVSGEIQRNEEKVGALSLNASVKNTRLLLEDLQVQTLNGTASASGSVDLSNLETTRLDLTFEKLKPNLLAWIAGDLKDVQGDFSGSLKVYPSEGQRPLGPVTVDFTLNPESGRFRTIDIGASSFKLFAAYQSPGDFRVVSNQAEIQVAGGKIKPFFRISRAKDRMPTQLLTAEIGAVELEPIVRAFKNDDKEVSGLVTGNVRIFGSTTSLDSLTAEADVRLTRSDLANFTPVAAMYNVLHIGTSGKDPSGSGRIVLRLEGGNVNIASAYYFNRGAFINGFGGVGNIQKFPDSPLDLTLFGSLRPLKDIKLPFFADADKLLTVLQASVAAVRADGTLHDPRAKQVSLSELGDTVQGVLLGKMKEESQNP